MVSRILKGLREKGSAELPGVGQLVIRRSREGK
jgi:hypothetical protein